MALGVITRVTIIYTQGTKYDIRHTVRVFGQRELSCPYISHHGIALILLAAAITDGVANNTEPLVYINYLSHGCLAA